MSLHWTYEKFLDGDDLSQGDILEITSGLSDLFQKYHKHFCDPKYIAFIVLTQSCDLVRREGACATRYISLAVVRQLEEVLDSLLASVCTKVIDGVFQAESKLEAKKLLRRILNQNEQSLGLFYLHQDADVRLAVPSVALLRVSVAFRGEHYATLMTARRGRLGAEFRNKLGWLVGNLYSRIGTPDWQDQVDGKKQLDTLVHNLLEHARNPRAPLWIPQNHIEQAIKKNIDLSELTKDSIIKILEPIKPKSPVEQAIERVAAVVQDVIWPQQKEEGAVLHESSLRDAQLLKICQRLRNDMDFNHAFKRLIVDDPMEGNALSQRAAES